MAEHTEMLSINGKESEEAFTLLSELHKNPSLTQRQISSKLDISLGKTNYLLKELTKKGIIKTYKFSKKSGKIKRIGYILTPKGIKARAKLTYHFLKRKEVEYNRLKEEWTYIDAHR